MEKLSHTTESILDENVEKLAALFPEVVTEVREPDGTLRHAIDADALRERVGDVAEGSRERYQFTWPGKREAKQEAYRQIDKCLRPCPEESVDWDTTGNLYIEGDNLDALKLLRNTYAGKVKMIYIDPPYNTGHDFIYDDDFARTKADYDAESGDYDEKGGRLVANPESNGRFHSDWCSMMYPRLLLARDLLSDDGVIFISIDDGELQSLVQICNEIFGCSNGFPTLCVEISKTQGMKVAAAQKGQIVKNHEYVTVYSANKELASLNRMPLYDRATKYDNHFDIILDDKGAIRSLLEFLRNTPESAEYFERYGLDYSKDSLQILLNISSEFEEYFYRYVASRLYQKTMINMSSIQKLDMPVGKVVEYSGYLLLKNSRGRIEQLQSFEKTLHYSDEYRPRFERTTIRGALWKGFYSDMMNVAKEGGVDFKNGKKPVRLIEQLAKWLNRRDAIILDFFSGSATTAHAVMRLNAEDGGSRKFIMVQLPEVCDEKSEAAKAGYKNICEIGKERIRRAGKKIAAEVEESNRQLKLGEEPKKVPDIGFRVLKIDSSNFEDVSVEPDGFSQDAMLTFADNLKLDRAPDDLIIQVMLKKQIELSAPIEKLHVDGCTVFSVDGGRLVACFDRDVPVEVMTAMAKMEPDYAVMRDASFAGDDAVSNFAEIFKNYSSITEVEVI